MLCNIFNYITMNKYDSIKKKYNDISSAVANYYAISIDEMYKLNREDCVNARYCAIYILCEKYTDADIAKVCNLSKNCINKIRNKFRDKLSSHTFREDYNSILTYIE